MIPVIVPAKRAIVETLLSGVYTRLYQSALNSPRITHAGFVYINSRVAPAIKNNDAQMVASETDIRPDGIGRFWVRGIKASVFLSMI